MLPSLRPLACACNRYSRQKGLRGRVIIPPSIGLECIGAAKDALQYFFVLSRLGPGLHTRRLISPTFFLFSARLAGSVDRRRSKGFVNL